MAFNTIVQGLNDVHASSVSRSFFTSQIETRVLNVVNFLREAWQIIVSLGEILKGVLGVTVKTVIYLPRQVVHFDFLERLNSNLSGCTDVKNAVIATFQLGLGLVSTAALGVVVNPNWNYSVHQIIGILPPRNNGGPAPVTT